MFPYNRKMSLTTSNLGIFFVTIHTKLVCLHEKALLLSYNCIMHMQLDNLTAESVVKRYSSLPVATDTQTWMDHSFHPDLKVTFPIMKARWECNVSLKCYCPFSQFRLLRIGLHLWHTNINSSWSSSVTVTTSTAGRPGFDTRRPNPLPGASSLIPSVYRGSFPRGKAAGTWNLLPISI